MASSHPPDDADWQQQVHALNASLSNAEEQLKAQGDAFLQRSKLKTTLGDHAGALDDAKRALALFPNDLQVRFLRQRILRHGIDTSLPRALSVPHPLSRSSLAQRTPTRSVRGSSKGAIAIGRNVC